MIIKKNCSKFELIKAQVFLSLDLDYYNFFNVGSIKHIPKYSDQMGKKFFQPKP